MHVITAESTMEAAVADAGVGGGGACDMTSSCRWFSSSATPYVPFVSCTGVTTGQRELVAEGMQSWRVLGDPVPSASQPLEV